MMRVPICLLLGLLGSGSLPAREIRTQDILESLSRTANWKQSSISPDGSRIAWTEALPNPDGSESKDSAIYAAPVSAPGRAKRITAGGGGGPFSEHDIAWSPDGSQLAFLSDYAEAGQPEIYVCTVTQKNGFSAPKRLTLLKGDIRSLRYSPDGSHLAFLVIENAKAVGPTDAYTPELGVIESQIHEQRIAVISSKGGSVTLLSPDNMFVYEFDWSPDSRQVTYTAAAGEGDNNWWIAKLYRQELSSRVQQLVCTPPAQIAEPHWSPDGRSIAFIGGLMSDQGMTGGDIYLVPAQGGSAADITPARKSSPNWIRWLPGAKEKLLFGETVDGGFAMSEIDLAKHQTETLWEGDERIVFGEVAQDGRTSAIIRSSWAHPPEVWAGPIGAWEQITHKNDHQRAYWGKSEKIHWMNGGHRLDGWLLYPMQFDAQKRYPMVVSIHGGPASQKSPSWPEAGFDLSLLASQGMFVFFPNPRGSYGLGESFAQANVKDFGYGDLSDVMAGVDQALKEAPIDPSRMGVGGWSYGGFMTMWTVTQTHRFKAAVAGAGIANWQSYYGQNLIDQWMIPYFGASVYDDPAVYAKSSPINYVKNVRTPTLLVVGERDAECPMPQSRELWHALKTLGVKTQLVVYANEGHHFHDPAHVADVMDRTVKWYQDNL
jgi:dipeptidyl aminopeptidase/acylaminoacyl peptidase